MEIKEIAKRLEDELSQFVFETYEFMTKNKIKKIIHKYIPDADVTFNYNEIDHSLKILAATTKFYLEFFISSVSKKTGYGVIG